MIFKYVFVSIFDLITESILSYMLHVQVLKISQNVTSGEPDVKISHKTDSFDTLKLVV